MRMKETDEQARERYLKALHAMQSGVLAMMEAGDKSTLPKHLRTGVNSALSNTAGLARLLIEKGVFTENEYLVAQADEMEREKALYEQRCTAALGIEVKLT